MKVVFEQEFDDKKGIECNRCMLSFSKMNNIKGETEMHCSALGVRPKCTEDGNRKDCPLVIVGK